MHERSYRAAADHWGRVLGVDPGVVFSTGTTVTDWDRDAVEILVWDGGVVLAAPPEYVTALDDRVADVPSDLGREAARALVAPVAAVTELHGPQFVGYCDRSTYAPADASAERIAPSRCRALEAACPSAEWDRSAVQVETDAPTFGVVAEGQVVAVAQLRVTHDVASVATVTRPDRRGRGHATAAVSRAVEFALASGWLPEYRTVEGWTASVALAERLGFERVARSLLVTLA